MGNKPAPRTQPATIKLIWVNQRTRKPFSSNILREVHHYLHGPFLANLDRDIMTILDVGTQTWRVAPLKKRLNLTYFASYVSISPSELLLCGEKEDGKMHTARTYLINMRGEVQRQPNMLVEGFPGLFHEQEKNRVLAFGGGNIEWLSNIVQVFDLGSRKWKQLEVTMVLPRCMFGTCQYYDSVLIVGGFANHVELFSLKFYTFSLLIFDIPEEFANDQVQPVRYKDIIFLASPFSFTTINLQARTVSKPWPRPSQGTDTCEVAIFNDLVHFASFPDHWITKLSNKKSTKRTHLSQGPVS